MTSGNNEAATPVPPALIVAIVGVVRVGELENKNFEYDTGVVPIVSVILLVLNQAKPPLVAP